jgi:hypothetical protein
MLTTTLDYRIQTGRCGPLPPRSQKGLGSHDLVFRPSEKTLPVVPNRPTPRANRALGRCRASAASACWRSAPAHFYQPTTGPCRLIISCESLFDFSHGMRLLFPAGWWLHRTARFAHLLQSPANLGWLHQVWQIAPSSLRRT